jgi:hypothetical protein
MKRTSDRQHDPDRSVPPIVTREELNELHEAYQHALDEYEDATTVVIDRVRRRSMPTAEEFARKRVAQLALVDARRAFWKANRLNQVN